MADVVWNGDRFQAEFRALIAGRIKAACIRLTSEIKADISQAGTLRYTVPKKGGGDSKRQATIYNFTHSRPGNPPYKQTGHLRRSVTWEFDDGALTGRVGSNLPYAKALELGTDRIAPRPFIRANFLKHKGTLEAIIAGKVRAGELPEIVSNQSRAGHLGAGAAEAGYD